MSHLNRRRFLQGSVATAGGILFSAPASSFGRVLGANDTIRVGVAGIHGRGGSHINAFVGMKNVEIAYLIDPDARLFNSKSKFIKEKTGKEPKCVQDVREALEDKNLDAISIATPNHWHSLMTIWACEAGKDVYVEKPMSHNVHEGRVAVQAARRYNRIVQHGTQSRSDRGWATVAAAVKSGKYGKLLISRGLCYKRRDSIGFKKPTTPPSQLDFNMWLGPAPDQPYHENLVHYNWHWFWDTGNGDIGNQGVHQMDIARWCIPGATLPKSVISVGGRFGYDDQGQTANTQIALMDFGETQLIFEVRGLETDDFHGEKIGNILHFEDGIIADRKFFPKGKDKGEPIEDVEVKMGPGDGPFGNFIAAMRSRKQSDLNAEILEGHYSAALCHLANVSYRLGEPTPWYKKKQAFGDNKEAYETLARMEEHLAGRNKLAFDGLKYQLGRKLKVDAANESIIDDEQAQSMLTRQYRKPFVVPDKLV